MSDRRSNECEGALPLQRAVLPGGAQRDVPSMPQGLAHDGAEPPRSRATQLVLGCGAASAVREETLYQEVNVTGLWSFQGRLRLSSHPEEASWARYHLGSELAVVSMLNYSLAMDIGLALGSRGRGIWRDGKGCSENPPNPDLGEGRKGQRSQGHPIRLCRRREVGRGHQEQSDKLLATPQRLLLERAEKATVLRNFTHCLQPPYCKTGEPLGAQKEGNRWCALLSAPMSVPSASEGINRESPNCAYEKKEEAEAGIRFVILYFHCLIWHQRGRGSCFTSQGCAGSGRNVPMSGRPVPAPMPHAHITSAGSSLSGTR